jgi:hypothetical protein
MRRVASGVVGGVMLVLAASALAKPKVAVLPMAAVRVEESIVLILNDILTSEVAGLGTHDVISSKEIDSMLGMEKMKSALGCDDVACLADIGGALGADQMLTGSVGKLGSTLSISLTLFNMRDMKVERRVRQKVEAEEDLYEKAMVTAVKKLFGLLPPDSDTIVGSSAAPTAPTQRTVPARPETPTAPTATSSATTRSAAPAVAADPGWAGSAATAGWVLGVFTLALAAGSDAMFNISDGPGVLILGSLATGVGLIAVPIIALGGSSARDNPAVIGSPGLRTAGWVAYASFAVSAGATFLYRMGGGDSPVFALIPGVVGIITFALFASDASNSVDQARALSSGTALLNLRVLPTLVPARTHTGRPSATPGLAITF